MWLRVFVPNHGVQENVLQSSEGQTVGIVVSGGVLRCVVQCGGVWCSYLCVVLAIIVMCVYMMYMVYVVYGAECGGLLPYVLQSSTLHAIIVMCLYVVYVVYSAECGGLLPSVLHCYFVHAIIVICI